MRELTWTLAALAALGGTALADDNDNEKAPAALGVDTNVTLTSGASMRGVAQDYLVLPDGGELTGQMKFVMSEPSLGGQRMRFSDLALFELAGRWSLARRLEISGGVALLPKQPSFTDEKPWQSVALGLRSPLGHRVAIAIGGAGGHLIDHTGLWTRESMSVEWRKYIDEFLQFDVAGGVDGVGLAAEDGTSALVTEISASTSALFREPGGHWGAWVGIAYALPVDARGIDPTTGQTLDPQPRLDFHIGTVLALEREWDLFTEFSVVDRGDLADPRTRLPILDGGFDQRQIIMGVTRHISGHHRRRDDNAMQIGRL
jgi:hypothetical protein